MHSIACIARIRKDYTDDIFECFMRLLLPHVRSTLIDMYDADDEHPFFLVTQYAYGRVVALT